MQKRILLTNDDGVMSPGLRVLYEALADTGSVVVVAPEGPRSATGMSLTFHKPLRIRRVTLDRMEAFAVSGNPADCVSLGVSKVLGGTNPDVVVSGINPGDNTSIQVVFTSGTVAAAIQAAILGIPAVAFSIIAPEEAILTPEAFTVKLGRVTKVAREIVSWVLEHSLPKGVDFLNINFPEEVTDQTQIRITQLCRQMFKGFIVQRLDPRGRPYYWQWGTVKRKEELEAGTDAHAIYVDQAISITPMSLNMSAAVDLKIFDDLKTQLQRI